MGVSQTRGIRGAADWLRLHELPKVMDRIGWKVSAQLMRRWFATRPVFVMPEDICASSELDYSGLAKSRIDDEIVKMQWVVGFVRVAPILERLLESWTVAGMETLLGRLRSVGWKPGKTVELGGAGCDAKELHMAAQVARQPLRAFADTFDELQGAMSSGSLNLAVVGKASRSRRTKRDIFEIEKIGVYANDSYDFNSDWLADAWAGVGIWSRDGPLSMAEMAEFRANQARIPAGWIANYIKYEGFAPLRSRDFRLWQKRNGKGGDFFVFSDVMWLAPKSRYLPLPT